MSLIKISDIKLPLNHKEEDLRKAVANKIRTNNFSYEIIKKSVDARKKPNILIIYSVVVKATIDNKKIEQYVRPHYFIKKVKSDVRPIVVGFGPAGMFCALVLATAGLKPIVLERGRDVDNRINDVNLFFRERILNEESNIQFGEGGAGTFSDGKLYSGVKDKFGRKTFIINELVNAGANPSIKYLNKPHVGTDYLVKVVKNIRKKILSLGGEVLFHHKVDDIVIKNGTVSAVKVGDKTFDSKYIVFAMGHSARDTFRLINRKKVSMRSKPFAVGVRIEHPQEVINNSQYGLTSLNEHLPVAEYKLTYRTKTGRSVYSFCMCPGGIVVNSSSVKNQLCVNGMSNYLRDEENANSAIVVGVNQRDFKSDDVLAGVTFQEELEKSAFHVSGDYRVPVQKLGDFKDSKPTKELGKVKPVNSGDYVLSTINDLLPAYVSESIKEAMPSFGRRIKGFDDSDSILSAVESRTSSPIRIDRDDELMSSVKNLYFAGEGAGFAGGIMSAAIDGMKIAEKIISRERCM